MRANERIIYGWILVHTLLVFRSCLLNHQQEYSHYNPIIIPIIITITTLQTLKPLPNKNISITYPNARELFIIGDLRGTCRDVGWWALRMALQWHLHLSSRGYSEHCRYVGMYFMYKYIYTFMYMHMHVDMYNANPIHTHVYIYIYSHAYIRVHCVHTGTNNRSAACSSHQSLAHSFVEEP